jgi:2-keto-3-deoxy-L-rhamnonate aldolase RhmA
MLGTFIKSPTTHGIEILADLGFDFVVVDQEHGTFNPESVDAALLAARAGGIAGLVRVPAPEAFFIGPALDAGADGVIVPHVANVGTARRVADLCRYKSGTRGFSAATRAGRYGGRSRWEHVTRSDEHVAFIAQIEDVEALDQLGGIAAVPGLDCLFVGRGDLTVAMGLESPNSPDMDACVQSISAAAAENGKAMCGYAADMKEVTNLRAAGATLFVLSSDQGFMRREATQNLSAWRALGPKDEVLSSPSG